MILALLLMLAKADPALADVLPDVDARICQMIIAHEPADGVAYEGGKDVNGKPVVEADLNPSPIQTPEKIEFDITIDLAEYIGLEVPQGIEGKTKIGKIAVDAKGNITFDGKPLEGEAAANLKEICAPQKKPVQKIKINNYTE